MKQTLALVTGATSGIGYSAAKQLVQDGWSQVIVTGRSQSRRSGKREWGQVNSLQKVLASERYCDLLNE